MPGMWLVCRDPVVRLEARCDVYVVGANWHHSDKRITGRLDNE